METNPPNLMDLVRTARKAGAAGSEFLHERWSGNELRVERGKVIHQAEPTGERLVVRLWLEGGREGVAEGPLDSGEALVEQAILAAADEPESALHGPVGRLTSVIGGLGTADRRYQTIEHEYRLEVLTTAERAARQVDRRVVPGPCWYEDRLTVRSFASSKGVELAERDTAYRVGGSVSVAGAARPIEEKVEARTFASVASIPFGTNAANIAIAVLPRGEQPEGDVRVLLQPAAVASLIAVLAMGFTASRIGSGDFFLQPSPDGEPVVDPRLHLLDDGSIPGALRSASFDERGVAPTPLTLLREGRVEGRYIDVEGARLLDRRPTGHLVGGKLRPRNLALRSGTRSTNVLLGESDCSILVVQRLPELSGVDLRTGTIEVPVSGAVLRNSKQVGGVSGRTLRGDLMVALNNIVDVASNTDRIGHVDAPAILLDGFTIE